MGEYFELSTKIKNEHIKSPTKKGWEVITKAILNPQAAEHHIFKENLENLVLSSREPSCKACSV